MKHTKFIAAAAAVALAFGAAACSTDKKEAADTTQAPATTEASGSDTTVPNGEPVPGVTDDTIKIGVIYLDLSNVAAILGITQGDYKAAYQAAIDEVNDAGGVHGRKLEAVMLPIDPPQVETGTVACTKLTEDEQVFVVVGSFLTSEASGCVVDTHATPLLGGGLEADLLKTAKASWLSPGVLNADKGPSLQKIIDSGVLDGKKVGVVGQVGAEAATNDEALPMLEAAGVDVVDTAFYDIAGLYADPNALYGQAETITLKFQSEGVDLMLLTEGIGSTFQNGIARTDFRPQLVFTDTTSVETYIGGDGADLSMMPGSVAVGTYSAGNVFRSFGSPTKECVASQEKRLGVTLKLDKDVGEDEPDYWVASLTACRMIGLLVAVLEKAGPDLTRASYDEAAWNLGEILLPGYDKPLTITKEHPNGSPELYLFDWDDAISAFVPRDN